MKLMYEISKVDRFDASWSIIEKREKQTLKQLKAIATIRSVGASTRIEGSKMTDEEVSVLIEKLKVSKLEDRDEQEVAGYFEVLDTIGESFADIEITEGNIKNLHNILMKYCDKDEWHRGNYKQVSNAVEATHADGTKQIIFRTAEPGIETETAMNDLFEWYNSDFETLPIIKDSLFVYDFLSIHPFQDGNGRLSRLLGTLLLLKHGYSWIQYISFEHEIESRKAEYYSILMETQRQRPGENITEWIMFFMDCLTNIQRQLMEKLKSKSNINLGIKEKNILMYIENHPGTRSGEIAGKLNIPLPTVKKILGKMWETKLIIKNGAGAGTSYHVEPVNPVKAGIMFKLNNEKTQIGFTLRNPDHFIEINKIVLVPLFDWIKPDDWAKKLLDQGINFTVWGVTATANTFSFMYSLISMNNPFLFQPVFNLTEPINLPLSIINRKSNFNEYPMRVVIRIESSTPKIDFDILFVYDEIGV